MKSRVKVKWNTGITLVEVLVVLAVLMVFAAIVLPVLKPGTDRKGYDRLQCVNNLRQIGLAFRVWEGDNGDRYPMAISETNGGTKEFITDPNAFRHFQVMSNELSTPKIVFCLAEWGGTRDMATNFGAFGNSNVSYFVGVDAAETNATMILAGDRNIPNGTAIKDGSLNLTASEPSSWTTNLHNKSGNILLADGSVQQVNDKGLRKVVSHTGFPTNILQIP